MEDLDALLVDLQASASAHGNKGHNGASPVHRTVQGQPTYPAQPQQNFPSQQHQSQYHPRPFGSPRHVLTSNRDSGSHSPPPPVPPHPHTEEMLYQLNQADYSNGLYSDEAQPIYEEQQSLRLPSSKSPTMQHSQHLPYSQQQRPVYPQPAHPAQQVPPPQRQSSTGLGHNLSELDSLLESLNSAQFMAEVEKKNAILQSSPPPNPPKPPEPKANAASSATKDLDDLMASLSGFHTTDGSESPGSTIPPLRLEGPEKPARQQQQPPLANSRGLTPVEEGRRDREPSKSPSPENGENKPASSPQLGREQIPDPKATVPLAGNALDSMLNQLGEEARKQGVNTTPKGHCRTCNKLILGQVVTAMGNTYHPEHFICSRCEKELGTETFFERDDHPYCEDCCHFLFSPKCAYCSGPITGKCMSALDKTWHPEHFFCAHCGLQFGEEEFHEKNEKVFCRNCFFSLFAARCKACNQPITANYVSALDGQWHNECFTCRECLMPFTGGSYFEHEGQPYCEVHYHARRGSLCAGCQKPITGRCITAMGRKFHPEHFVCSFCLKQLNKGTFKEQGEKPYCHACYGKLFG